MKRLLLIWFIGCLPLLAKAEQPSRYCSKGFSFVPERGNHGNFLVKRGNQIAQRMQLPSGWITTDQNSNHGLPGFLEWCPDKSDTILVVIGLSTDESIWEWRRVFLYKVRNQRLEPIIPDRKPLVFSNLGSFYCQGRSLYVWDIDYDTRYAHYAPQQYRLRRFRWIHSAFVEEATKITKKRYTPLAGEDFLSKIPSIRDPLREFHLQWRWWEFKG